MIQFDYDSLDALAAVAREGTFEAAARTLNVTQSAVSQRIKQLEERVGAILIIRGRPCVPTEFGQQLCRHIDQVSLLEHELRKTIGSSENYMAEQAAVLRIAVNSDSLATWFPYVIQRANRELNIHFDILPDDQEHTVQKLKTGEALAAVTANETPVQGCRRVSLGAMEYLAVASPNYIAKHFSDGITLDAIQAAPALSFDRKDQLPEDWLMLAFGETVPIYGHLMPSYEGYLMCCINGSGWGLMPIDSVAPYLQSGELVELVPEKRVMISLHWQSSVQSSEVLRLLAAIVSDEAKKRLKGDTFRS